MDQGEAPRGWIDRALELSVAGSWSKVGYLARARLGHWSDAPERLRGRRALVTGGTGGIGRAAALSMARGGAHVGIVGREPGRVRRVADELTEASGSPVWPAAADLGDLGQIEDLAAQVHRWASGGLDVLVHGAGLVSPRWHAGPSGLETTVAVHLVGPHLLTARVEDLLARRRGATVVWVSSGGMYAQPLRVDRLEMDARSYRGLVAYSRTKRAQVALAELWDRHLAPGCRSFAMHPGWVDTAALHQGLPRFARLAAPLLRTAGQGADTIAWLAAGGPEPDSPAALWLDRAARPTSRWPVRRTAEGEDLALWRWCQRRAGLGREVARR